MNKKLIVLVGLVLLTGVGAACWRTLRNGVFTERACAGPTFSVTDAFVPTFDFAELRSTNGDTASRVLQSSGSRCAKATVPEACELAVAAATAKVGWNNGSHGRMAGHNYLVVTRGDEVLVIDGATRKVGQSLAPIDSPVKAAVVALVARGVGVSCDRSVRTVEGGFEVHLVTESCLGPADEVIAVAVDGSTTVLSSEHGQSTCVGQVERVPEGALSTR